MLIFNHQRKGRYKQMTRKEIERENKREKMLNILIKTYGFESEPTLYFATWAWKDIYNMERYFETAKNWKFLEED